MKINISVVFYVGLFILTCFMLCILIIIQKNETFYKSNERFYKSNTKVSVIILNHKRSHNLKKSIPILSRYKNINEIIILHSNEEHFIKHEQKKVKDIKDYENNKKFYTLIRFLYTKNCKNDAILFLDDDVIPSKQLLLKMLTEYDKNPVNCFGVFSRLCDKSGYHTKTINPNIVLTPILLSSKVIVNTVWKSMLDDKENLNKVIKNKGNGEDLFFMYMFQKIYKQKPIVVSGSYKTLDKSHGFSTTNPLEHYKLRNDFCKTLYN